MADEANDPEYTIKKGDTLWDISSEKLKDPFSWSKIWKANPQIKNPDLIFPGQKLNLLDELGQQEKEKEIITEKEGTIGKKAGKIITPTKLTRKNIPIRKPSPLTTKEIILRSGYITNDIKSSGKISYSLSNSEVMGQVEMVYMETDKAVPQKTKFYILSTPEKIFHPLNNNFIGYLIRVKGVLETTGMENSNLKASIITAYEEIATGDLLADFYPVKPPVNLDSGRRPAVSGSIIKLWNNQVTGGTDDIVYIDKGSDDGIAAGDVFNIITGKKPNTPIGSIQVINVQSKTAVAYVNKAVSEIEAGDSFKN